jgi:hypothetical protein
MKIRAYSGTYIEGTSTVRKIFNQDDVLSHSIRGKDSRGILLFFSGPFSKSLSNAVGIAWGSTAQRMTLPNPLP